MTQWSTTTKHEPSSINKGQRYELKDRVSIEQLNNMTENSFYAMEAASDAKQKAEEALSFAQGSGTTVFEEGKPVAQFDADKKADKTQLNDYYTKEQVDDLLGDPVDIDLSNYYTKSETYSKEQVNDLLANLDVDIDFSDYYTKAQTDSLLQGKANKSEIPDVSAFITKSVSDLVNYYTKAQTYTQAEVNALVSAIPKFAIQVVTSLPTTGISGTTIYLLKTSTTETGNLYTEYIYTNGTWESLGTQTLDLSGYLTIDAFNTAINSYYTKQVIDNLLNNKADKSELSNYATNSLVDTVKTRINDLEADVRLNRNDIRDLEEQATNIPTEYIKQVTVADNLMIFTKQDGTNLTVNDFTSAEKNKLANLSNYDDSAIQQSITNLQSTKANKTEVPTQYVKNAIMEYNDDTDKLNLYLELSSGSAFETDIPYVREYIKKATVSDNLLILTNQDDENITFSGGGAEVIVEVWK